MFLLFSAKKWQWSAQLHTILAAIAAQSVNISVGLCQGYSAILLPQLNENDEDMGTTPEEASWIASIGVISNPIGALLGGLLLDAIGRKLLLQSILLPNLTGWIVLAFSSSYLELCIGRFITGLTIGMASACYIYVAEVSKPSNRSVLSAIGPALVSLGIFIVYVLGAYVHWQKIASICAAVSIITPLLMYWVPESPLWLYSKGKKAEALEAMIWLRNDANQAADELRVYEKEAELEKEENKGFKQKIRMIGKRNVILPFITLLVFFVFQELSGIYIILYYSVDFFKEAGTNVDAYTASIIVGALRLGLAIVGAYLINKYNRKSLAVSSGVLLGLTMLGAAIANTIGGYPTVKLVCILLHVCSSMVGFLQLPWIMSGELYPNKVRGTMAGITACCGYLFIFINIKTYPSLQEIVTYNGTLYLFASFGFLGAVYCMACLTETQGKTLLEISESFKYKEKKSPDLENNTQQPVEVVRF